MLKRIQCPGCGASMEVDSEQEDLRCKFCGQEIPDPEDAFIDDEDDPSDEDLPETEMHTNRRSGFKTVLSKGAFVVSCIVIAFLVIGGAGYLTLRLMRGCRSGGGVSAPTPTPAPTPVPGHVVYLKTLREAPPLEKLGISPGHLEEYEKDLLLPENWLDMTADDIQDFRIIRSVVLGCSYVVQDGEYYRLGEGDDGKGLLDYCVTDMDYDDVPDLLYTYHFGANEDTCSKVGWFNLETHENVMSDFSQRNGFLAIIPEDGNYILCRADRAVDPELLTFGLTVTERLGELVEVGGRITVILDAPPTPAPTPEP